MTKGELIKTLEGLNDDAVIYIGICSYKDRLKVIIPEQEIKEK